MKKLITVLLSVCMLLTVTTSVFAKTERKSIVQQIIESKLGITEDTELTDDDHRVLSRGEFANLLYNYLSLTAPEDLTLPFKDVENSPYKKAIAAVFANGVMNGVSDTEFAAGDPLTRQEASTILYRGMRQMYPDMDFNVTKEYHFTDDNQIADWAREAVVFLYDRGFMLGTSEDAPTISPLDTIEAYQGKLLIKRILMQFF